MLKSISTIIKRIGEDLEREGLQKTPERFVKCWKFLTSGYKQDAESILSSAIFEEGHDDLIIVKDIDFYSTCEHHLLPFFGKCHIAYLPGEKIVGISKLARVVETYARRLQLQERLTHQIAGVINKVLEPKGVGVVIKAQHMCMIMRGVQKINTEVTTSSMLGCFRDEGNIRNEFLTLI